MAQRGGECGEHRAGAELGTQPWSQLEEPGWGRQAGAALLGGGIAALGYKSLGACLGSATSRLYDLQCSEAWFAHPYNGDRAALLPAWGRGQPHPGEDLSGGLGVGSGVSQEEMQRQHRLGAQ